MTTTTPANHHQVELNGRRYRLTDHTGGLCGGVTAEYVGMIGKADVQRPRRAGVLQWSPFSGTWQGEISRVVVGKTHRRRGLATAMLAHAKQCHPEHNIHHSHALTSDGQAWAEHTERMQP